MQDDAPVGVKAMRPDTLMPTVGQEKDIHSQDHKGPLAKILESHV